jgi:hypothetical protein
MMEDRLNKMIFGGNWAGPGGLKVAKADKGSDAKTEKAPKEKFSIDFSVAIPADALACGSGIAT